jgi:hypothetical protein
MSRVSSNAIRSHWAVARLKLPGRQFAHGRLEVSVPRGFLAVGVTPGGVSLLVPVASDDRFAETEDVKVSLCRSTVDWGEGEIDHLEISCHDEQLEPVFAQLCAELIEQIESSKRPGLEVRSHFDRWRSLFASRPRNGLGRTQLIGLFGELQTLGDVMSQAANRDLSIWIGPTGASHDFEHHADFLEVKSTTSRNETIIEIHGMDQLRSPDGGTLHLVVHHLSESDNGFTINDQVERLVDMGVDRIALYERLSLVGYDWADTKETGRLRLRLDRTDWYLVDDDFPRLIDSSLVGGVLPAGVVRVNYSIDLTGPCPAPLDDFRVKSVIRAFGG